MIVRLWCGRTPADKADDYLEYVKRTGVAEYRATEGNRSVRILRRVADGEDDQLLLELEPHVKHYELVLEAADD